MLPEEDGSLTVATEEPESRPGGVPLYVWVIGAVILAIPVGMLWGDGATRLNLLPSLIIRALKALAAPLVILAILSAIVTNDIRGRQGARMMLYYLINTLVAMAIGLGLTNLVRPGAGANLGGEAPPADSPTAAATRPAERRLIDELASTAPKPRKRIEPKTVTDLFRDLVPDNIADALLKNNLAQLVLVTVALAIALAQIRNAQIARGEHTYRALVDALAFGFEGLSKGRRWVVALV